MSNLWSFIAGMWTMGVIILVTTTTPEKAYENLLGWLRVLGLHR